MGRVTAAVLAVLAIGAIAAVVWATGRPATLDAAAVDRETDSVASLLAEGSMLAGIVADGDGYDRATKVRATELADTLDTAATTLDRADIPTSRTRDAFRASLAASDGSTQLARLVVDPGDRDTAAEVRDRLAVLAGTVTG